MEKIRSFAFKTLMISFKNDYYTFVPEKELKVLKPIHFEFIHFLKNVFTEIPVIWTKKRLPGHHFYNLESANFEKITRKAKLYDLYGYYSFNKDFRRQVFSESVSAIPLLVLLSNYRYFKTKFKEQYIQIFSEFADECRKGINEWNSNNEMLDLEFTFLSNTEDTFVGDHSRNDLESTKSIFSVENPEENLKMHLARTKLSVFLNTFCFSQGIKTEAMQLLEQGDLMNLFLVLIRNIEKPLSSAALTDCFELYMLLLKIKHHEACPKINHDDSNAAPFKVVQMAGKSNPEDNFASVRDWMNVLGINNRGSSSSSNDSDLNEESASAVEKPQSEATFGAPGSSESNHSNPSMSDPEDRFFGTTSHENGFDIREDAFPLEDEMDQVDWDMGYQELEAFAKELQPTSSVDAFQESELDFAMAENQTDNAFPVEDFADELMNGIICEKVENFDFPASEFSFTDAI